MRIAVDTNTILSGLFFPGNERRLLLSSLQRSVTLLLAEDIVDEVYEVMIERFRGRTNLPGALELLASVLAAGEVVRRENYAPHLDRWRVRLRDPSDAPLLACAAAAMGDGVVSGDRDVLQLRGVEGMQVYRTRDIVRRLGVD